MELKQNLQKAWLNPIQGGGPKGSPYQFFPCNLYKSGKLATKTSDF